MSITLKENKYLSLTRRGTENGVVFEVSLFFGLDNKLNETATFSTEERAKDFYDYLLNEALEVYCNHMNGWY